MKTLVLLVVVVAASSSLLVEAKSKGSRNKVVVAVEEADEPSAPVGNGTDAADPSGSLTVDPSDPRVEAQELQKKIETIHALDSRDPLQLAQLVLTAAFVNFSRGQYEVSVPTVLRELNKAPPRTAMYILRILELLDANMDFKINVDEFEGLLSGPVASTERLVNFLFTVQDYNSDGVISRYEMLTDELLGLGVNYNLFDMWRAVTQKVAEVDLDRDQLVSAQEYAESALFQITRAIVLRRDGSLR